MAITKKLSFSYKELNSINELDAEDQELVHKAIKAAGNAYAPYSLFKVGAAVRLSNNKIVTGANVENAAFPSGICAERSALSGASSNFPEHHPVTMAIVALTDQGITESPVSPCGNCRQVISEQEFRSGKSIKLILTGKDKIHVIEKIADLLPLQFTKESLKPDQK